MDHHESDMWVKATPEALQIIEAYENSGGLTNRKFFNSNTDNSRWIDIPFGYIPFWAGKSLRSPTGGVKPGMEWELVGNLADMSVWQLGDVYSFSKSDDKLPANIAGAPQVTGYPDVRHVAIHLGYLEEDFAPLPSPTSKM